MQSKYNWVETNIRKFNRESVMMKDIRQIVDDDNISTNNESIGTCAYNYKK